MIHTPHELDAILPKIEAADRVGVDTEADSLHCYFEKLCLLQISVPGHDYLIDPLADLDLSPLAAVLAPKEIVLQGADFDLRLLRRSIGFVATRVFDTVVAARLLGIREFSLAALVLRYYDVTLKKGAQKANWARRPLPRDLQEYAKNDTHYLIGLADKLEAELRERGRYEWFAQSCARGLESSSIQRVRDEDEAWRISGSGALRGQTAAILRELWRWRDEEARAVDRPSFHILQNHLLLEAAQAFAAGDKPSFRHFSERRRRGFEAAAARALTMDESEWPEAKKRVGKRMTKEMERAAEFLRQRRDAVAVQHGIEPAFIAPRAALDAMAVDQSRSATLLAPWQRQLLEL